MFAVTTNVDDDTAEVAPTWQTAPREAARGRPWLEPPGELTLKAEEDDLGTQVRCIVDSVKDAARGGWSATRLRCGCAWTWFPRRTSRWTRAASHPRRHA
ncbi:MAG: hypothetical protein ACLR3C_15610 [Eggerthella lenta]